MSTKSLIRAGASLASRFLAKPFVQQSASSNELIALTNFDIAPRLFPSLSKYDASVYLHQNETQTISKVSSEGFLYPCGLPSLRFFLPDGHIDSTNIDSPNEPEPMLLFPKRTFQPSTIRRKRNHGFFARKATKGGRRVIARRIVKGRSRITA